MGLFCLVLVLKRVNWVLWFVEIIGMLMGKLSIVVVLFCSVLICLFVFIRWGKSWCGILVVCKICGLKLCCWIFSIWLVLVIVILVVNLLVKWWLISDEIKSQVCVCFSSCGWFFFNYINLYNVLKLKVLMLEIVCNCCVEINCLILFIIVVVCGYF